MRKQVLQNNFTLCFMEIHFPIKLSICTLSLLSRYFICYDFLFNKSPSFSLFACTIILTKNVLVIRYYTWSSLLNLNGKNSRI